MEFLGEKDVPLADLTRFPGNARIHATEQLKASVKRLGQYRSIVVRQVDNGDMVILAGNGTADAMASVGHKTVRAGVIKCTDDEARRINVADNRLSDIASDDRDALTELLSYFDGDYEGLGFTTEEVDKLIDPPFPDEEEASVEDIQMRWGVIVECGSEDEQLRLLEQLSGQGLNVRSLMA